MDPKQVYSNKLRDLDLQQKVATKMVPMCFIAKLKISKSFSEYSFAIHNKCLR
ncbi:hypothetical protein M6B38_100235 [Iris pallida]|uniref:Uncharacterized protein n=1 Tax=Iris pallida TaxID=29817 RepID=A0AAX6IM49_IRIPA|nr:hypothetical protein M6B38_263935 [Iris pallida]KAJ6854336.1 hypothetical protein M6B38_100235 [Iris pallida]